MNTSTSPLPTPPFFFARNLCGMHSPEIQTKRNSDVLILFIFKYMSTILYSWRRGRGWIGKKKGLTADGCLMGELWETLFWFSAVSWGAINISYGKGESGCMKEQVNNFFKCCFQLYLTEPPMHSTIAMIADYTTLSLSGCLFFFFLSILCSILLKEAYYCRMMIRK